MFSKTLFALGLGLALCLSVRAQSPYIIGLQWENEPRVFTEEDPQNPNTPSVSMPSFQGAYHEFSDGFLPRYLQAVEVGRNVDVHDVAIEPEVFGSLPNASPALQLESGDLPELSWTVKEGRGKTYLVIDYVPLARMDGSWVPVTEAKLTYRTSPKAGRAKSASFAQTSVLASGQWFRI